jgi:glycosyltransferase involved in cell wall biosynthesis
MQTINGVMDLLFSVVIPAYNAENFICEALDSVAKQTISNYEVMVVNDGSTDQTADRVKAWAESHPAIELKLIHQANKGIGGARNTGVYAAKGEFIAFLDADDLWIERKLSTVFEYLDKMPKTDLVCHDEWLETNRKERTKSIYGPYVTYKDLLFKGNSLSTSATVVRREHILKVGGFSEDLKFNSVEDYDLWLRLAKSGTRISYLHEILGIYRAYGRGVTNRIEYHCQNDLNLLDTHFQIWEEKTPYYRYLMRRRKCATLRNAGYAFMRKGDRQEASKFLKRALFYDPVDLKTWLLAFMNIIKIYD